MTVRRIAAARIVPARIVPARIVPACIVVVELRGRCDEAFRHDQAIQADAAFPTNPILSRFPGRHIPHPAPPIDEAAHGSRPHDTARMTLPA